MKFLGRPLIALFLSAAGAASAQAPTPAPPPALASVALSADLQRVLTDYEAAWRARDAAALSRLFTEDGFVLSGGHPPVRGRNAIREHYSGAGGALSLRALAFAVDGALGYVIGGYSRGLGEPDVGKFTLTLRRGADGRWLIVSDMDNGNQSSRPVAPAPTPSPAAS